MKPKVGWGGSGPLSRWVQAGGAPLRWGPEAASGGQTFEEDLALLEGQIPTEHRGGGPRRARGAGKPPRIRAS